MAGLEIAIATRVISQPLLDMYNAGKNRYELELQKWKNAAAKQALARKVAITQKVKPFWQRDKEVLLTSFYYPNRVNFGDSVTKNVSSLRDFAGTGNFVIQGTVGQGKSIFLRYLCIQELKEVGSSRIPVFIELRMITSSGLRSAIFSSMDRLGFAVNNDLFEFYAESKKIVLLLDAFDELDENLVKDVIRELEEFSEKYPNLQIFVTARPQSSIQESRHFRVLHLAPLLASDYEPFIKRIGIKGDSVSKLMTAISESSSEVSDLLTTPLMLTLFVIVYKAEQAIPKEVPDFFDALFQTLFTKHDKSKPGFSRTQKSGLGERALQQLFQAFCFSTIQLKQQTTLTNEMCHKALDVAIKYTSISCSHEAFLNDVTKITCLMQEEGYLFHFIHKSVLEFYSASFVRGLNEEMAQKFYSQLVGSGDGFYRWRQVIQFLSRIDRYRYTRYFAIPSIAQALAACGVAPPYVDLPKNVADQLYNSVSFSFSENNGKWTQGIVGPYKNMGAFGISSYSIVGPKASICRKTFSSEAELLSCYPSAINETDRINIPWSVAVTVDERATIDTETNALVNNTILNLRAMEKYVKDEDDKADLLVL